MPASHSVRPFESTDVPALTAALRDAHATDGYPVEGVAQPDGWIGSPGVRRAWVAELNGQVVGHVALMDADGEDASRIWREQQDDDRDRLLALGRLFVTRDARGRSLGEALARTAMEAARGASHRLVLDVMVKDQAAIRLYERLGWRRIGEAIHHHGDGLTTPAACYTWPAPPSGPSRIAPDRTVTTDSRTDPVT